MYTRVVATGVLLAVLAWAFVTPATTYTELLTNADFETGNYDPWVKNTGGVTLSATTEDKHGGTYSLKIVNTATCSTSANSNGARQGDTTTAIPVTGGEYYTLRGWVRAPSLGNSNLEYAWVRIRFYQNTDYSGSTSDTPSSATDNTGAGDTWSQFTLVIQAPAWATRARVVLYVRQKSQGNGCSKPSGGDPFVYSDDLTLYHSTATVVDLVNFRGMSRHSIDASFLAARSEVAVWPWLALVLIGVVASVTRRRFSGRAR